MKSIRLPDEMIEEIKGVISEKKYLGYESITEFVRSAVRKHLMDTK